MIKAALLDLDGTLLDNDINDFLQAYLRELSKYMAPWIPPERLIPQLLTSTSVMLANLDPVRTLQQAFASDFYPALHTTEDALFEHFMTFYREEFPKLKALTRLRPAARELVAAAIDEGLLVAVATNPLFPRIAIDHRLAWAGVPSDEVPFALVTSYEVMHSAKPHRAYYAEILGRLGVNAYEAVMIGDNPDDDLTPAQALGMAVFHIGSPSSDLYPSGGLKQAVEWLPGAGYEVDEEAVKRPANVLARLHGQLGSLLSLLLPLDQEGWARRPEPGSWSVAEIICHLRDLDHDVHLPRMRSILSEDDPFVEASDTDRWAIERGYASQSGPEALASLVSLRVQMLAELEALPAEAWARPARHALLGPTTLAEVLSIAADHERLHLADLRLLAVA